MSEQPRKSPEGVPEAGPEAPGSRWLTMPAIGALLGMSERAARDWVRRHALPMHGSRPVRVSEQAVLARMAVEERVARKPPEGCPEGPGSPGEAPGSPEPIEAAYRVAGEAAAGVALVPLATMVEELRGLADQLADLARRNEGLALEVGQLREREAGHAAQRTAQGEALAAHRETIAELRRRAEAAEGERDALRLRLAEASAPPVVVVAAQEAPRPSPAIVPTPPPSPGLWARLRRALGRP